MSESAAQRRANQTVRNLILSMLATLGVVLLIVLGVPRDDSNRIQQVDYQQIAQEAQPAVSQQLIAPAIPSDWWSNAARLESSFGVDTWYIGFVTPDNQYIGLSQAFEANPSWEALTLQGNWLETEVEIAGKTWEVWPTLSPSTPPGTKEYAMLHRFGNSAVVIYGTAAQADFVSLAEEIAIELGQ